MGSRTPQPFSPWTCPSNWATVVTVPPPGSCSALTITSDGTDHLPMLKWKWPCKARGWLGAAVRARVYSVFSTQLLGARLDIPAWMWAFAFWTAQNFTGCWCSNSGLLSAAGVSIPTSESGARAAGVCWPSGNAIHALWYSCLKESTWGHINQQSVTQILRFTWSKSAESTCIHSPSGKSVWLESSAQGFLTQTEAGWIKTRGSIQR